MSTVLKKAQEVAAQKKQDLAKNGVVSGGSLLELAKENQQKAAQSQATTQPQTTTGYVPSDTVTAAQEKLNTLQKPGEYNSQWQSGLNDIINKIMNREKFSYDLNGDALYQQYKDQYVTQGQQAMMDTMGQAAALTGGYGNSYAQTVGQQTYQGYLQQLNDKVPELYQLALDQYNREGDEMYNQYGLLADRENTEYGRYRDQMTDYYTDRDYLTNQYNTEREFDYGSYRDDVADKQWQDSFDYQKDRDAVADSQWQAQFDESVRQFDTSTQIQQEQWQAEFNEGIRQFDKNYELTVQQIQEDIRHNKITEAQGQAQIDLAKAELEQQKEEFKQEMAYKYAALNKSSDSSGGGGGGTGESNNTGKAVVATGLNMAKAATPAVDDGGGSTGFSGSSYEEAVAYQKKNGVDNAYASGIMTNTEFRRWSEKGNFDSYSEYLSYITKYNIEKYGK